MKTMRTRKRKRDTGSRWPGCSTESGHRTFSHAHPPYPVLHHRHEKVEQQSRLEPTQPQVRAELSFMHGENAFDGLHLDDQLFLDEQVDAIGRLDLPALEGDR